MQENIDTTSLAEYENQMIEAFVNKPDKTFWYQNAFSQYQINGIDNMAWKWSWWAFFSGPLYLLYRKVYLEALVLLVVETLASFIPFVGLIVAIATGGYAPYLVYKKYKSQKQEIERTITDTQKRLETMRVLGGYNTWVIWVYALIATTVFLVIVVSLVIPIMSITN